MATRNAYNYSKSNKKDTSFEVFKYLADNVADVNATDDSGRTALWHCIASGSWIEPYLPCLLDRYADFNLADFEGRTALHRAVMRGSLHAVEMLAKHGANANVKDHKDLTPLHENMKRLAGPHSAKNIKIAECLLFQLNDDPDARSHDGTYAMYLPTSRFHDENWLAHMLLMYSKCKSSDNTHPYKPYPYRQGDVYPPPRPLQRNLEKVRADNHVAALINRCDQAGNLLLVYIAGRSDYLNFHFPWSTSSPTAMSGALSFIELGADFNKADASGTSLLQAAINAGNNELRDHLLSLGASINAVSENGQLDN
jgi:uncharacterized protein